jgi:hypothetical protein
MLSAYTTWLREQRSTGLQKEGMGHAAMAPEVAVLDAEVKTDDIQVWNNRTDCA